MSSALTPSSSHSHSMLSPAARWLAAQLSPYCSWWSLTYWLSEARWRRWLSCSELSDCCWWDNLESCTWHAREIECSQKLFLICTTEYTAGEQWNTMNLQLLRGMPVYLAKAAQGWLCTGSFLLSSNLLASLWYSSTIKLLLRKIPPNIHLHKFLMTWDCYNCNLQC